MIANCDPFMVQFNKEESTQYSSVSSINIQQLSVIETPKGKPESDWYLVQNQFKAKIGRDTASKQIILTNGLISRSIRITPDATTIGLENYLTGESMLRGVKAEARITLNGEEYAIGGLEGQVEYAYLLPEWIEKFTANPKAFHVNGYQIQPIQARFPWKQKRYATNTLWPPKGLELQLTFSHQNWPDLDVVLHYEIYDGIPLTAKWMTIQNRSQNPIILNSYTSEILALAEYENYVDDIKTEWKKPNIHFESDFAFNSMRGNVATKTSNWMPDPQFTSQINYNNKSPCLFESRLPLGPNIAITSQEIFESHRNFALLYDSTERERNALTLKRMYRIIMPWITENPIFMHFTSADPRFIREGIDQCVAAGFEMLIITFGTGLNMELDDPEYYEEYKEVFEYAHQKGIEIGTYSLFSSRSAGLDEDVVDPKTEKTNTHTIFGKAPCLCSKWGIAYLEKLKKFMEYTGADILEHDGPYPGDVCASKNHPGHQGLEDSQWNQWKAQANFYKYCRSKGIFINAPDWYYMNGTNKNGMGYREVNWSLPRSRQIIHARQNIYDGTWDKTPSMGWMFTPLTVYHAVGDYKESTIEPLSEHLFEYNMHLMLNFGAGVMSCYRGKRLFDSPSTEAIVKKWVSFYKQHRAILDSDILHIRRPMGTDYDAIMHVNPHLEERALVMIYNPLQNTIHRTISLPLYYTGLTDEIELSINDGPWQKSNMNRMYDFKLDIELPAQSGNWIIIRKPTIE